MDIAPKEGSGQLKKLGQRLRAAIKAAKYRSVQQFCVDRKYPLIDMYRWIGGKRYPRYETVVRLAADLGVRAGWLLFGEGEAAVQLEAYEPAPSGFKRPTLTGGGTAAAPLPSENPDQGPRVSIMSTPPRKPLAPIRRIEPAARRAVAR